MTVTCPSAPVPFAPGGVKQEEAPKGPGETEDRRNHPGAQRGETWAKGRENLAMGRSSHSGMKAR